MRDAVMMDGHAQRTRQRSGLRVVKATVCAVVLRWDENRTRLIVLVFIFHFQLYRHEILRLAWFVDPM